MKYARIIIINEMQIIFNTTSELLAWLLSHTHIGGNI